MVLPSRPLAPTRAWAAASAPVFASSHQRPREAFGGVGYVCSRLRDHVAAWAGVSLAARHPSRCLPPVFSNALRRASCRHRTRRVPCGDARVSGASATGLRCGVAVCVCSHLRAVYVDGFKAVSGWRGPLVPRVPPFSGCVARLLPAARSRKSGLGRPHATPQALLAHRPHSTPTTLRGQTAHAAHKTGPALTTAEARPKSRHPIRSVPRRAILPGG